VPAPSRACAPARCPLGAAALRARTQFPRSPRRPHRRGLRPQRRVGGEIGRPGGRRAHRDVGTGWERDTQRRAETRRAADLRKPARSGHPETTRARPRPGAPTFNPPDAGSNPARPIRFAKPFSTSTGVPKTEDSKLGIPCSRAARGRGRLRSVRPVTIFRIVTPPLRRSPRGPRARSPWRAG
jgi:hypothetical protein